MRGAILRADGSSSLGMGHLMRCLAVAEGLREIGLEPVFVVRRLEGGVGRLLREKQLRIEELPPELSFPEDARRSLELASKVDARVIVTDLCHQAAIRAYDELKQFHRILSDARYTLCFAGAGTSDLPADILVRPYYTGVTGSTVRSADEGGVLLEGPEYFVFREEFREAARANRVVRPRGDRVLVTIGGSDPDSLSVHVMNALLRLPPPIPSVRLVIGPGFSEALRRRVKRVVAAYTGDATLRHYGRVNLADEMLWADLAVTGDGLTKYETAVTGTPSIILSRRDSEQSPNREFERAGSTLNLGVGRGLDADELAREIRRVLDDASLRKRMSERGREMVDGRGLSRVLRHLPEEVVR